MKFWSKFFVFFFVVVAIAGCTKHSETLEQEWEPIDDKSVVYMNVSLKLPSAPSKIGRAHV